jgi:hypothetical protein
MCIRDRFHPFHYFPPPADERSEISSLSVDLGFNFSVTFNAFIGFAGSLEFTAQLRAIFAIEFPATADF